MNTIQPFKTGKAEGLFVLLPEGHKIHESPEP